MKASFNKTIMNIKEKNRRTINVRILYKMFTIKKIKKNRCFFSY